MLYVWTIQVRNIDKLEIIIIIIIDIHMTYGTTIFIYIYDKRLQIIKGSLYIPKEIELGKTT